MLVTVPFIFRFLNEYFGQRNDGHHFSGGFEELMCPVCVCGVHDATHSYVSEWSQHMQHLQTESESVPILHRAVLTIMVLASGKYN